MENGLRNLTGSGQNSAPESFRKYPVIQCIQIRKFSSSSLNVHSPDDFTRHTRLHIEVRRLRVLGRRGSLAEPTLARLRHCHIT